MRWSIIRLIWLREMRDQLRDRRTLFMIAVLPLLLYPVLGYGVLQFALGFREKPSVIGVVVAPGCQQFPFDSRSVTPAAGAASPARLGFLAGTTPLLDAASLVHETGRQLLVYPPLIEGGEWNGSASPQDPEGLAILLARRRLTIKLIHSHNGESLEDQQVDLILTAPTDFLDRLERSEGDDTQRPSLHIRGHLDQDQAQKALQRLQPLLDQWKKDLKRTRLSRQGLGQSFDDPIRIQTPEAKPGGMPSTLFDLLVRVFPFILVMWSLAGALYPAIDLCAGEKERGTMETLLITPAGREEIVLGKFLTIWVFSAATALLNLISMGISTWIFGQQLPTGTIPPGAIFWCAVLILPLSALFSAISLAIGAYARSSKEGQYYLMPMFLVTMPLIFLTLAPGVELNPFYSLVPVTGVALLMQKLMTAASLAQVPWLYFIPVLAPVALYSGLALRWAIDQFQREEVLFREAERVDVGLWLRSLFVEKPATPTMGQAAFCFAMLIGLRWLTMGLGQRLPLAVHTAVHLLAFVAAPTLLMTVLLTTRPREGLAIRWPSWSEVGLAGILAVLLLPPLATLATTVFAQFPHLTKLLEDRQPLIQELRTFFQEAGGDGDWLGTKLLVYALLPALCEEAAFRGFILAGLLKRFRPRTAILVCSFLFALFHMNVFQFLPAFFLGVVLGLLTVRSRSLLPAILFHALHNSVLIVATTWGRYVWTDFYRGWWPLFILGCFTLALGLLWWLYRKPYVAVERECARWKLEQAASEP